jgi:hypothetical protein
MFKCVPKIFQVFVADENVQGAFHSGVGDFLARTRLGKRASSN